MGNALQIVTGPSASNGTIRVQDATGSETEVPRTATIADAKEAERHFEYVSKNLLTGVYQGGLFYAVGLETRMDEEQWYMDTPVAKWNDKNYFKTKDRIFVLCHGWTADTTKGVESKQSPLRTGALYTEWVTSLEAAAPNKNKTAYLAISWPSDEGSITNIDNAPTSFWRMRERASDCGETAGMQLLKELHETFPNKPLHLIGYSFGCIVLAQALRAYDTNVQSVILLQAAMSCKSFNTTGKIDEFLHGKHNPLWMLDRTRGAMYKIPRLTNGRFVVTSSNKDTALSVGYKSAETLTALIETQGSFWERLMKVPDFISDVINSDYNALGHVGPTQDVTDRTVTANEAKGITPVGVVRHTLQTDQTFEFSQPVNDVNEKVIHHFECTAIIDDHGDIKNSDVSKLVQTVTTDV